ncbi:hypothetical protein PV08_09179 [Exophiala spinifera]|uniref:O-methyltransferase n=1 Tax=Exophiala spinifera TaxID=91928 RepID=A0A0D1YAE1_9EURO|nr:uncharacterized protein PV08_09179 [Exophiala spinifera]KIW11906.1 hypothetical protein PV08_09179 [Exophiala spinifera]
MSVENAKYANDVSEYVEAALCPATPAFAHAYSNTSAHGIPEIALSPSQGKLLSILTRVSGARNVLEIGTLGGYSALWLAQGLKDSTGGGKLTSIEIDPGRRDVAIENLEYGGVKVPEQVDILLGAALDVLPKLADEIARGKRDKFDVVFIDADWDNQWAYFDWAVKLSNGKGSLVYVDNVVRQMLNTGVVGPAAAAAAAAAAEEEEDVKVPNLVEKVGKDERVDGTVIQTCGGKNYDGFLLAIVR